MTAASFFPARNARTVLDEFRRDRLNPQQSLALDQKRLGVYLETAASYNREWPVALWGSLSIQGRARTPLFPVPSL
jgi:hypothetical protein